MTESKADSGTPKPPEAEKLRHPPVHWIEFGLVRALETAVSTLPERASNAFGRMLGRTIHRIGTRRDVVSENLRIAFPEATAEWRDDVERRAYEHLGREAAAMLRLSKLDASAVIERTETAGWELFQQARSLGRGVILVTGHYGNWEIAAATVAARGAPISAIVRRQGNRIVDGRLRDLRSRLGVATIYQSEAPKRVPRVLRANGVVGIVADQDARGAGIFVPFFGKPASTHRGPALFAIRYGAPVLTCSARRLPGKDVRYEVTWEEVPVVQTGDLELDVRRLTADLALRLEGAVRRDPDQYFWFHKRWKSKPEE